MKKLIALLLALAMVLCMVACGENDGPQTDKPNNPDSGENGGVGNGGEENADCIYEGAKIKFWSPVGDVGFFDRVSEAYYEKTGCQVSCAVIPWGEMSTKYVTAFMTGQGPDVFYMTAGLVADLESGGCLLDLSDYFTEEELAERNYINQCYYNGILHGVPYNFNMAPRAWAYNMDMLNAVGITEAPDTWDEFIDAAVKIKEAGLCEYPVMLPGNGGSESMLQTYLALLYSNGGAVCSEDLSTMTLDSQESLEVCQFIYDLVYKYEVLSTDCLSYDTNGTLGLFYRGRTAMCTIYADAPLYKDAEKVFFAKNNKGELKQIYTPFNYVLNYGIGNDGNPAKCACPIDTLSVNAMSKNVDAAVDFVKFLCKEGYEIFYDYNCELYDEEEAVVIPNLFKDDEPVAIVHDFHRAMVEDMENHSFTMPALTNAATMDVSYFSNYQLLIMGEITPEECVANMQNECTAALEG